MTERIVVGQDGRKHITTEPKLHTTPDDTALLRQALEAMTNAVHYVQTHLQYFDDAYNRHPSAEHERGVITDDIEDCFAAIAALRKRLGETK